MGCPVGFVRGQLFGFIGIRQGVVLPVRIVLVVWVVAAGLFGLRCFER